MHFNYTRGWSVGQASARTISRKMTFFQIIREFFEKTGKYGNLKILAMTIFFG